MVNLSKILEEYLIIRRQLGFDLSYSEKLLKHFISYLKQKKKRHITVQIALKFVTFNSKASLVSQQALKLSIIRKFATYLSTYDIKTEVPGKHLLPFYYHRRPPYIFSDEEIIRLLDSCQELATKDALLSKTYYTIFGLIAVTGMRTGEALALTRDSVDLEQGIITISESKFRKSRKIPIHASTIKVLKEYSKLIARQFKKKRPEYFFVNDRQKLTNIRGAFKKACVLAGINTGGKFAPRITDLRHSFAVKTLLNCYKTGDNVDTIIPILVMYLGHENPKHTYWYLTGTPQLMSLIIDRLNRKFGG